MLVQSEWCTRTNNPSTMLLFPVLFALFALAEGTERHAVSSIHYNPDSSFSGRIKRFVNGDHSPAKSAFSLEKNYPLYAYKPNCSLELVVQTWVDHNAPLPAFGTGQIAIPTVTKNKTWKCFYRSSWLNEDDPGAAKSVALPKERYITTLVYCPSMNADGDDGRVDAHAVRQEGASRAGMCPLLNKAITKEGGASIKVIIQLSDLPEYVLQPPKGAHAALQIGPLTLRAVSRRGRTAELTTRYTTNTLDKFDVKTVTGTAVVSSSGAGNTADAAEDKCRADWADLSIVGRCFGLKTHSEYPSLKHISLVQDANQCKSLCCGLGNKCVTWQYWVDIKLCKLGKAVRIGKEHANTELWCDSEPPITWAGEKLARLPSGAVDSAAEAKQLSTQCFGLGNERFKHATLPGASSPSDVRMTVEECRKECRSKTDCNIWQAHKDRGCFYANVADVFCEPYKGGFAGGRRKCNDKCSV